MAHYAFLDENNIVTNVIVGRDEYDLPDGIVSWEAHYGEFRGQVCKRTSYNTYYHYDYDTVYDETGIPQTVANFVGTAHRLGGTPFRGTYAGIGYTYDAVNDVFVAPPTESDTNETEL